eukprot:scaffold55221_cov28-Tisochrysis_lutea.AAC.5
MLSSRANLVPKLSFTRPPRSKIRLSQMPRSSPTRGMRACSGVIEMSRTDVEKRSLRRPWPTSVTCISKEKPFSSASMSCSTASGWTRPSDLRSSFGICIRVEGPPSHVKT